MSARTTPPYRADHVGSLLRPPRLLQAREHHAASRITDEELRSIEDDAIKDVVKMQEDVGLKTATDGEFRRALVAYGLHLPARRRLEGAREPEREVPQCRRRHRVHARRDADRPQAHARAPDLRRRLQLPPTTDHNGDAEAHDPEPSRGRNRLP